MDEAEVVAQLAELHAIPGVTVVPMVPADLADAVYPPAPKLSDE